MNIPVCGYFNYVYGFFTYGYGLIPIVFFACGYYMINRFDSESEESKLVNKDALFGGALFALFFPLFFSSAIYLVQMGTISNDNYVKYNNTLLNVFDAKSEFNKDQKVFLKKLAECSVANGEISDLEYEYFMEIYKKYQKENENAKNAKKIKESIKETSEILNAGNK